MSQRIGVVGAKGDLGSQLTKRLQRHGFTAVPCTLDKNSKTISDLLAECDVVHICAPLRVLDGVQPSGALIVLHDSVMSASHTANRHYLGGGAAIAHLLMNTAETAVVATDALHHDELAVHLAAIGLQPKSMTIAEHDHLMARSQAPLALLCKTLLPYLYEQADKGFLTPSGQLLADTLRARELVWTDETIRSILANPQLPHLVEEMQAATENLRK